MLTKLLNLIAIFLFNVILNNKRTTNERDLSIRDTSYESLIIIFLTYKRAKRSRCKLEDSIIIKRY